MQARVVSLSLLVVVLAAAPSLGQDCPAPVQGQVDFSQPPPAWLDAACEGSILRLDVYMNNPVGETEMGFL